MRCVKHHKLICFSPHCRGEARWMDWPAPRVPVPPPAAPQAGRGPRLTGFSSDDETLGVPVVPVYQPGGGQRSPLRKAAPSAPRARRAADDDLGSLTNPTVPLHQEAYGGSFSGATDAPGRCTPPTDSSSTSSSSSSGYDGGSSSSGGSGSSSDSGSSSTSCD